MKYIMSLLLALAVVPGLLDFFLYSMSNSELQKDELGSSATLERPDGPTLHIRSAGQNRPISIW